MRAELEQVYRQHRQALFSLALTITGCSGLAEDAVHEAFVRLCGRQERAVWSISSVRICGSAETSAVDCCRRVKRDQKLAETLFAQTPDIEQPMWRSNSDESLAERLMQEIESLDGTVLGKSS